MHFLFDWVDGELVLPTMSEIVMESHYVSLDKGWWDGAKIPDTETLDHSKVLALVEEKLALIHSEVSEALEDFRRGKMVTTFMESGKPVGLPTEIADVMIRCFDLQEAARPNARMRRLAPRYRTGVPVAKVLNRLHMDVAAVSDRFHATEDVYVLDVASHAFALGESLGFDMVRELRTKQAYNKTRTHRHGGKAC